MVIAIDIGNSSITIGYFIDGEFLVQNIATHPIKNPAEYTSMFREFLSKNALERDTVGVIISSVVPSHTGVVVEACERLMPQKLLRVSHKMETGLVFDIPRPEELGSDRIANVVAAYELYKGPVAVVDCGTATTVSVVGKRANYIGGSILPGARLMGESLARGTSKLPEVPLRPPGSALGIDTFGCIQSGLFYGTAGAIERLLTEIEREVGSEMKVVVTGGYGDVISKFLRREHILRPHLTIEGLKILYARNRCMN
jgi:type III pantothenate kinase